MTRVVAIEGRRHNIAKAQFVQSLQDVNKIEWVLDNLETFDLGRYGHFDAIFCRGVLYHLPNPWRLIEQCAKVSDRLYLHTHYADVTAKEIRNGYRCSRYQEAGLADPLSGLSPDSFWLTLGSLLE